jgi:hypothetical protein
MVQEWYKSLNKNQKMYVDSLELEEREKFKRKRKREMLRRLNDTDDSESEEEEDKKKDERVCELTVGKTFVSNISSVTTGTL